ncbi:MAG: PSD1 and planctomycete cytochrome C domain-containing protein [Fuerstiella sp.]|nr:PSD1 and planctomycete cytochrome C domain-containing protein [Fuerstiella sp.]
MTRFRHTTLALLLLLMTAPVRADGSVESDLAVKQEYFELKVRPLLLDRCATCHSGEPDADAPVSMLSRAAIVTGGDYGPAVVPGRSEDSLLVHAVRRTHKELRMPPDDDDSLTREESDVLARWIDDGAVWPGSDKAPGSKTSDRAELHASAIAFDEALDWALRPRQVVAPPDISDPLWSTNAIDRFVHAHRLKQSVTANAKVDRRTLIRRVTLDLTGLPPIPQAVESFVNDPADDAIAFANVVDRLLASDQYGERQGRLWLDVARYADTQGDVGDIPIQTAWRYRNWVINALNRDMPYDRFLQAQLAGDILSLTAEDEQLKRELTIATGFIALSRRFGNEKKESMHLTIEDTIDTIGRGVLGLTLRCSRCHDHKFDPISNADYYGLYGIFESTTYPWMGMSVEKSPSDLSPAIPGREAREKATSYWDLIARYEYQINNHFRPWLKPTLVEYKAVTGKLNPLEVELATLEAQPDNNVDRINELQQQITGLSVRQQELLKVRGGKFRELMLHGLTWIKNEKLRLAKNPEVELVFAVGEGNAHDTKLHRRGNPDNKGDVVPRHFVSTITGAQHPTIGGGSGRLELAQWLTDPDHPLTARVIVNRVWQQHFGRGLVATPDNFGRQGSTPSHPELLDWLANQFVKDGWSFKSLHRLIVLTETYQLASTDGDDAAYEQDPDNVLLWRYARRRLDAESIRDSILAVSGQLQKHQPTAHDIDPWYKHRYSLNAPFHQEIATKHRSVYLLTQRLFRHSLLGLFDSPDRNTSTSRRDSSNVPAQALFLMNSPFIRQQATALAQRVTVEGNDDNARVDRLYQLIYGRPVQGVERNEIMAFLEQYRGAADTPQASETAPVEYVALCRTLLTSNEFFFVD